MADITLDCGSLLSSTCVPNIFIDKYMTNANGEFVDRKSTRLNSSH